MLLATLFASLLLAVAPPGLLAVAPSELLSNAGSFGLRPDPTLHLFQESLDGGLTVVVGEHWVSQDFVRRIRGQLHKDATAYALGQYPNPDGKTAAVATLRASAGRIRVTYVDIPRGGKIVFRTHDARLVSALHAWMAATVRVNQRLHRDGGPGTYPVHDDDDG